jgi:hypothetical protein
MVGLEQRIASALSEEIASTDVATLITETEAAIVAADTTAKVEREKALDPVLSPDPAMARVAMEDASFTRDRLRTALPRLHARLKETQAAEYLARWEPQYERVKATSAPRPRRCSRCRGRRTPHAAKRRRSDHRGCCVCESS